MGRPATHVCLFFVVSFSLTSGIHLHMLKKIGLIALLASGGKNHHHQPHHYPVPLPVPIHAPHVIETPVHHESHHHHHHHHEVVPIPHHVDYYPHQHHHHESYDMGHHYRPPQPAYHMPGGHGGGYGMGMPSYGTAMESVMHQQSYHPSAPPPPPPLPSYPQAHAGPPVAYPVPQSEDMGHHGPGMPRPTRPQYYDAGRPQARSDEGEDVSLGSYESASGESMPHLLMH